MGQLFAPSSGGIKVIPNDRETGPGAGPGNSGDRTLFLGAAAGTNNTQADVIALGNNALSAGLADANMQGTIVLGSGAASLLTAGTADGADVIIGWLALANAVNNVGGNVVIGTKAVNQPGIVNPGVFQRNVAIGSFVLNNNNFGNGNGVTNNDNVVIGHQAAQGGGSQQGAAFQQMTVIGSRALLNWGDGNNRNCSQTVAIGDNIAPNFATGAPGNHPPQQNTFVGSGCAGSITNASGYTIIGAGANAAPFDSNVTIMGTGAGSVHAFNGTVIIGAQGGPGAGQRCVILGYQAGTGDPNSDDRFIVETAGRAILYGDMNLGNLLVGNSTVAGQRAVVQAPNGATNILGIMAGTPSLTNPTAGGYLYSSTANGATNELHWINSAGIDTQLSGPQVVGAGTGQTLSPAALAAGTTADYAPAGFAAAQVLRLTTNAGGSALGGLAGGAAGRFVHIVNLGPGNLTLNNQDAGSTAANRFQLPGGGNAAFIVDDSVTVWYDTANSRWRQLD